MSRFVCVLVVLSFFIFSPISSISADLYRWVDEKGVVHFTDNPHNIPDRHRGSVTRIKARETQSPHEPTKAVPLLDKVSVPFQRKGQVVIIKATVNEKASANFVVDTGASYTMISKATAKELDIDLEKKHPTIPFQTANGVIEAPMVSLKSVEVGGIQIKDLTAAIHDVFPDPTISGLLGLNFLSNFRLDIDTQNGVLHLERK